MEKPNFYGILPANVRYDKKLKPMEKILYTEITALTNAKGYCYATNSYFANLYDVHKNTVGTWISNLESQGYVKTEIVYKNGTKEILERRIYIITSSNKNIDTPINEKIDTYQPKDLEGINKNIDTPINEIIEDNNININNTRLILKENNIYCRVIDYLNQKTGSKFNSKSKNTQRHVKARCNDGYGLDDFKTVVDNMCEAWIGTEWENYLRPSTLFGTKFESYLNWKNKKIVKKEEKNQFKGVTQESINELMRGLM